MKDIFFKYPYKTRVNYISKNAVETLSRSIKELLCENAILICIGTDRCIGDALGPLVGTMLENSNFHFPVYGTLDEPIHALNLEPSIKKIKNKHPNGYFIAIDACLGNEQSIGNIHIKNGPIFPGKGVGKKLPSVGKTSIVGIVDKVNEDDFFAIHNIRLSLIMNMAQVIADAFIHSTYLP